MYCQILDVSADEDVDIFHAAGSNAGLFCVRGRPVFSNERAGLEIGACMRRPIAYQTEMALAQVSSSQAKAPSGPRKRSQISSKQQGFEACAPPVSAWMTL